jgi:hypothetical protein
MGFIRLTGVEFAQPVSSPIEVTVKYKLSSEPNIGSNYILVGTTTINTDGSFTQPFDIAGLTDGETYTVLLIPLCGGSANIPIAVNTITTTTTTSTTTTTTAAPVDCGTIESVNANYEIEVSTTTTTTAPTLDGSDDIADAVTISGLSGNIQGDNTGATRESFEEATVVNSVWYKWVAPETGSYRFDTEGSSFDTILSIGTWSGSSYSIIELDDDTAPISPQSIIYPNVTQGVTYYIRVEGYNAAAAGMYQLNWYKL